MAKTVSEDRRELLQSMMARDRNFYFERFHCIQLSAAIVAVWMILTANIVSYRLDTCLCIMQEM